MGKEKEVKWLTSADSHALFQTDLMLEPVGLFMMALISMSMLD
jgi:hypothetical protein